MNYLRYLAILSATTNTGSEGTEEAGEETANNSSAALDKIKEVFTRPYIYIVLVVIVLAIVAFYLVRRITKAKHNATIIIVRDGKIYKVVDEACPKYFRVPFKDNIGAVISHEDQEFTSDQLFINNGPDALYKVNYTLTYRVVDPKKHFPYVNKINEVLPVRINDELRLFADKGNALLLVKDYRENTDKILEVVNNAIAKYSIKASEFKINLIEPMGK